MSQTNAFDIRIQVQGIRLCDDIVYSIWSSIPFFIIRDFELYFDLRIFDIVKIKVKDIIF